MSAPHQILGFIVLALGLVVEGAAGCICLSRFRRDKASGVETHHAGRSFIAFLAWLTILLGCINSFLYVILSAECCQNNANPLQGVPVRK